MKTLSKQYQSLTLFGQSYDSKQLMNLVFQNLKRKDIPKWEKRIFWFFLEWLHPNDWIPIRTSGSTGPAKSIYFSKQQMIDSALATQTYFDYQARDRALLVLDMAYVAAKMMVVRAFVSGLDLHYAEPAADPFQKLADGRYDFVSLVPMQVSTIMQNEFSYERLKNVKQVLVGGGAINEGLKRIIKKELNSYYASFGMAETLTHIGIQKLNGEGNSPFYTLLPGVKINVDERNCLQIFAPWISSTILQTNDIIEKIDDAHFRWIGRFDNLINSGGVKISPESVEQRISHIMQCNFLIFAEQDDLLGQKVAMLVEKDSKLSTEQCQKIRSKLTKFEMPKVIYYLKSFIYTQSRKINRKKTIQHFYDQLNTLGHD